MRKVKAKEWPFWLFVLNNRIGKSLNKKKWNGKLIDVIQTGLSQEQYEEVLRATNYDRRARIDTLIKKLENSPYADYSYTAYDYVLNPDHAKYDHYTPVRVAELTCTGYLCLANCEAIATRKEGECAICASESVVRKAGKDYWKKEARSLLAALESV